MNKFNHTGHKALWNWLADHPGKEKIDYYKENNIYERQNNDCYACEYTIAVCDEKEEPHDCKYCPLIWNKFICYRNEAEFSDWLDRSQDGKFEEASVIARKIANLPVKEGVETI